MALFNVSVWQKSRFTLQWFIINLVGSLSCLTAVALAQSEWGEGVSGSVSIPDVGFTCLGNLAVFMTAFTRGRLDVENGARDVLATTRGPKLNAINGCGLTTLQLSDLRAVDEENGDLTTRPRDDLRAVDEENGDLTTRPRDDLRGVDVVLLSKYNERPHSSLTQFMQYISHSHELESILLKFLPVTSAQGTAEICDCEDCQCVVFWATEEIMVMLAHRLPGTLKRLSQSQCLLPYLSCLQKGCHGCNQGLLYVDLPDVEAAGESSQPGTSEEMLYVDLPDVEAAGESSQPGTSEERLREDNPRVDSPPDVEAAGESSQPGTSQMRLREDNPRVDSPPAAVCEALNKSLIEEEDSSCICIPVYPGNDDRWTKFMIKFLKSKENEAKGIKVVVSDALQHYITHSAQELGLLFQSLTGCIVASETYDSASLILPRVAEVIVNMGLTGWLRVDGFSSSLAARRTIRDYVVDSTGTGFAANAFLTEAAVFCSGDGTNVCQVLWFRGGILSARRVSYMVGCMNLICSIAWSVMIALKGNWAPSMPLSTPRVSVIIGAVGVALGMDCFELYGGKVLALFRPWARARAWAWAWAKVQVQAWTQVQDSAEAQVWGQAWLRARAQARAQAQAQTPFWWLGVVVILEVVCIVGLVVPLIMNKGVGRWVYSGMQVLVWVKWGIGSFLLGDKVTEDEDGSPYFLWTRKTGTWVYCSAFLLNAMLAGVRRKWVYFI